MKHGIAVVSHGGDKLWEVAFTPKGGCPLKLLYSVLGSGMFPRSIHPQGWVPIETDNDLAYTSPMHSVAFTPKGGCPLKPSGTQMYCTR